MEALVTLDIRRLPALRRACRVDQATLARRMGTRPETVSRFETMVGEPGGFLERYVNELAAIAAETAPRQ